MKTFFTLLATIISLSAYTIVGVHANCTICPKTVCSAGFNSKCTQSNGDITRCRCIFLIPVILFDPGSTYRQNRYLIKKGGHLTGASMTKMETVIVVVRLTCAQVA
ncbi:hypothetical protein PAXRUDRAFT_775000 [Paxillus rubicundulus Ve08.2h10]|uniref:Extracellular membrane protein CFEM domain-containing protein n=1 Tax=Paxillus rubicundulus Ve08.2h10 TaxID=930991 RepID=A0A0D0D3E2_9AGAM|nr:hypothetical protein PAXRUDRAFT_775000 [Paxillus rubicundulus Ve08.2h10]